MTTHPPLRRDDRRRPAMILTALLLSVMSVVAVASPADARAPHGPGVANVTLNGFTHPQLGAYLTDVGRAFCIESGAYYPGDFHYADGDIPAARGVSLNNRRGLAYILWEYAQTNDNVTAAGLATVVYGLSGDAYASTDVPSMSVSNPAVKAKANDLYQRAMNRAYWLDGPWTMNTEMRHEGGMGWTSIIRVRTASGRPVVGKSITVVPYNVNEGSGSSRTAVTDENGNIVSSWNQTDPHQPITIDSRTTAPAYYSVWRASSQHQAVITPRGTTYTGRGQDNLEGGVARVRKATSNPAYQDAVGATFDVQPAGGGTSLGTLTVGAGGYTNALALPPGDYQLIETGTPAGVVLDPTPHRFSLAPLQTLTIDLVNDVDRSGKLDLLKVDAVTGEPVAGATLNLRFDADADGSYETDAGTYVTEDAPIEVDDLLVGNYQVSEVAPPEGYLRPTVSQQFVSITPSSSTITVTFANHKTPTVSTYSQAQNTGVDGNITVPLGTPIHDVAVVNGLADGESATINLTLYGPFESQEALAAACTTEHVAWSGSYTITGSGHHPSPEFTPAAPGIYGYVETLKVPDVGEWSGECGTTSETVTVDTPTLATQAQAPLTRPGAPVTDLATVTGLDASVEGVTIQTSLYGPFENDEALALACESGDLGTPVGTVTDGIAGSGDHESSPINLPTEDFAGIYTFLETLLVPGLPPITHECGTPPETFTVPAAPTITTHAQAPVTEPGKPVADLATVTGLTLTDGEHANIQTSLYGPFKDADALALACESGDLGTPVGTVTHEITEDGETLSPTINLPTENYAGIYTFQATLDAPGYAPISHDCGMASETFTVTKVTDGSGGGDSTTGTGLTQALPRTGAAVLPLIRAGMLAATVGAALLVGARRRRDNEGDLY